MAFLIYVSHEALRHLIRSQIAKLLYNTEQKTKSIAILV